MEDWREFELSELLEYEQPSAYIVKSTNYDDSYSTPVLTAGKSFILGYTNETNGICTKHPLIVFDDFTTSTQYVDFSFKVKSSALKILHPNLQLVLPKFIYYRLQIINFDHSTHKRYWIQHYSKQKIKIPTLAEQERIVSRIEELFSELDNGVATLKRAKAQLTVYRQAVYAKAFDIDVQRISITNAFDISSGITKNSKRNQFSTKLPYLRVANVYYNRLDLKEIKEIGVAENEIEKALLKTNDLLFVEGNGSKSQIGRVALWDGSLSTCLHQNHIIKARANGHILPQFALFYMMSTHGRKQILKVASSTSGLYTLSSNKIKNLEIPDCSIADQERIIRNIEERLSTFENIEAVINTSLRQAESMRQSILKKAFEGKLI